MRKKEKTYARTQHIFAKQKKIYNKKGNSQTTEPKPITYTTIIPQQ